MAIISVLSPQVANTIAAGEVVERPASVAKELLENAVDAGANSITVEIRNGGTTYLRVTDNGCGMDTQDARTAFLRHATSKIKYAGDLATLHTLGFRGEALAAIAAVSKVDLFTKQAAAPMGFHLALEAGQEVEAEETGCPDGTTILIKDLFYNTPARCKFLKKDSTESAYVESVVENAALSNPNLSIKLIRDGKEGLFTPGDGKMYSVIYAIYGRDFTKELVALSGAQRDITVGGYVTLPSFSRANRGLQHFFINGRPINSRLISAAVEQAYSNRLTSGRYPACFLDLRIHPSVMDINIHPAKLEVKFANDKEVFNAVFQMITAALDGVMAVDPLEEPAPVPQQVSQPPMPKAPYRTKAFVFPEQTNSQPLQQPSAAGYKTKYVPPSPVDAPAQAPSFPPPEVAQVVLGGYQTKASAPLPTVATAPPVVMAPVTIAPLTCQEPLAPQAETEKAPQEAVAVQSTQSVPVPDFRVIGELFSTYLLLQIEDSLVMLDKHAGHERMIYNRLQQGSQGTAGQALLTPETITLSKPEKQALLEHQQELAQAGFEVEDFGEGSVIVRQVPMYLAQEDIGYVLSDIAGKMLDLRRARAEGYEEILKSVACKAAIKAGTFTDPAEYRGFVEELLADPQVRSCPHGRPVLAQLTRNEIEKLFKRIL